MIFFCFGNVLEIPSMGLLFGIKGAYVSDTRRKKGEQTNYRITSSDDKGDVTILLGQHENL